jgi:asparagine synthase (glutamine-hydrolysing)
MCGIAGVIHLQNKNADPLMISKMLEHIKHRGPDDEGVFISENLGLGHVRLSIIDLSKAGHQPMFNEDGRYCIVFNGEIYNYIELKAALQDHYSFKTKTDTEVLLAAYIIWGEACLSKFNGDFSFVIYDSLKKEIFGARDRFGIKPFYFSMQDNAFVFASEIKAILPVVAAARPNNKSIYEYLLYNRTDQSEATFFENINKLKHGHCFTIKNNKVEIRQWYNLADHLQHPTPMTPAAYREELKKAVGLRLRSDVPVGVCLSGGIDSSAITSIVCNDFKQAGLNTFSAVFEKGSWADESPFIDSYKGTVKNMHAILPDSLSFFKEFKDFITLQSEPMPGASPYVQYKVMQLAKGKAVVTLDGQGADEMLGGYNYFFGSYFKELLKAGNLTTLLKECIGYYKHNPSKEAFSYFLYYLLPIRLKNYAGRKIFGSLTQEFYMRFYKESTISSDLYNPASLHDFFLQHFEHKLEHLLKWDDLNSMKFSIESRIPFLDHNLVEKTLSLPSQLLLKNGISKYILRESVKDILPSKIYERQDKKGFATPADAWFRDTHFKEYIYEMLHSKRFQDRGYFDVNDCIKKYQRHLSGKENLSKDIWKWINLEVWFQQFIDA